MSAVVTEADATIFFPSWHKNCMIGFDDWVGGKIILEVSHLKRRLSFKDIPGIGFMDESDLGEVRRLGENVEHSYLYELNKDIIL